LGDRETNQVCLIYPHHTHTQSNFLQFSLFLGVYNNVWPDVPRTSGLKVKIKRNVKEKRKSTSAPRFLKKTKPESPTMKKLKQILKQLKEWEEKIKNQRPKKKRKIVADE
jgi:hypothetical protein